MLGKVVFNGTLTGTEKMFMRMVCIHRYLDTLSIFFLDKGQLGGLGI